MFLFVIMFEYRRGISIRCMILCPLLTGALAIFVFQMHTDTLPRLSVSAGDDRRMTPRQSSHKLTASGANKLLTNHQTFNTPVQHDTEHFQRRDEQIVNERETPGDQTVSDILADTPERSGDQTVKDILTDTPERSGDQTMQDILTDSPEMSGDQTVQDILTDSQERPVDQTVNPIDSPDQTGDQTVPDIPIDSPGTIDITKSVHQQTEKMDHDVVTAPPRHSNNCNFVGYQSNLCLDCDRPRINRDFLANCTAILYNRVPKCASSTMGYVFKENSRINNYTMYWLANEFYTVTEKERSKSLRLMNRVENRRFLLIGHFYYYNFSDLYPDRIVNINLVREPTSWFVSAYNFYATQSVYFQGQWWNKRPISDCIRDISCLDYILNRFGPIRFFCGNTSACENKTRALILAKQRVQDSYLLVGVMEELSEFNDALEYLLPHMFRGISRTYHSLRRWSKRKTKTKIKEDFTEKDRLILEGYLTPEIELYEFVRRRFYKMKQAIDIDNR